MSHWEDEADRADDARDREKDHWVQVRAALVKNGHAPLHQGGVFECPRCGRTYSAAITNPSDIVLCGAVVEAQGPGEPCDRCEARALFCSQCVECGKEYRRCGDCGGEKGVLRSLGSHKGLTHFKGAS